MNETFWISYYEIKEEHDVNSRVEFFNNSQSLSMTVSLMLLSIDMILSLGKGIFEIILDIFGKSSRFFLI